MKILFIITGSIAVSRCYDILEKLNFHESHIFEKLDYFDFLEKEIYPNLFEEKTDKMKVWIVGVGTGEDVYNYLLPLIFFCESEEIDLNKIKIFCTDIVDVNIEFSTELIIDYKNLSYIPKRYYEYLVIDDEKRYIKIKQKYLKLIFFSKGCFLRSLGHYGLNLIIFNNILDMYQSSYRRIFMERVFSRLAKNGIFLSNFFERRSDLLDGFNRFCRFRIFLN